MAGREGFAANEAPVKEEVTIITGWRLDRVREFLRVLEPYLDYFSEEYQGSDGRLSVGVEESWLYYDKLDEALEAAAKVRE
jgi:hypothetical protein